MKCYFSPTLMCVDMTCFRQQVQALAEAFPMLHADVMDGHFAENLALSPATVRAVRSLTDRPIDVHLMVERPGDFVELFAEAGATYLSVHVETVNHDAFRMLERIRSLGCKTGLVLNPATPLEYARHCLPQVDLLSIMTVDIGFAGQRLIPEMMGKIGEAVQLREATGSHYLIQADGGCEPSNYQALANAGVQFFVVGTAGLFDKDDDIHVAIDSMRDDVRRILGTELLEHQKT